jgi:hypothetical protein
MSLINYEEYQPGTTKPGSVYSVRRFYRDTEGHPLLKEFSKFQVGLDRSPAGNGPWFVGGIIVEVLKKGCAYQAPNQWTTVYFNPFVRTWVDVDHPLILSQDDAVAIFGLHMGTKKDAGSDSDLFGATPFEDANDDLIQKTPMLDYEDTDDYEAGRTYYYGRTYFAETQGWTKEARLLRKYSEMSNITERPSWGFQIAVRGKDGAYFDNVEAYLIKPLFQAEQASPFRGFKASRPNFWIDLCDGIWSCAGIKQEILINEKLYEIDIQNFGESPSDHTALGFLHWAIQYDDPGDNMVTGGI